MALERFLALHQVFMMLSHDRLFFEADRRKKLEKIVCCCAEALDVSRVGIWRFDHTGHKLENELTYLLNDRRFFQPGTLYEQDFPQYFQSLKAERVINADQARTDKRTQEFSSIYLEPSGIHSMLDVPIFNEGELAGILCLEHLAQRSWQLEEISFATSIADLISLINLHDSWQDNRRELEFLHNRDLLTRLENRETFQRRLEHDLAPAQDLSPHCLLLIGMDGFKAINDRYGFQQANKLLVAFADRLHQFASQQGITAARIGGDIFGLWPLHQAGQRTLTLIRTLQQELQRPVMMADGSSIQISFSISATELPVPGYQGADPMRCAEYALLQAKTHSKGGVVFFENTWVSSLNQSNQLDTELVQALSHGQIKPHYQPIVQAHNGAVVGIESLARWEKQNGEIVPPGLFLPRLAALGLIPELGKLMLEKSCADLARLLRTQPDIGWVAINIASEHLSQPDFIQQIQTALYKTGLSPHQIKLEIIEDLLAQDTLLLQRNIRSLRQADLKLSIDDFGTGYSSMARLKQLPIANVKIDRSFVNGLPIDLDDQCIARSVIGLAKGMGMSTTAEGIETRQQLEWMQENGCDFLQGYLIARPMPMEALTEWLVQGNRPA